MSRSVYIIYSEREIRRASGSHLFEGTRIVVGECTRSKSSSNSSGADMSSKLQDCSLSIRTGTDDDDISGILDRGNDAGGKNEFLPGLANVDYVDTVGTSFPHIWLHVSLSLLATQRKQDEKVLRNFLSQCGIVLREAW